MRTSSLGCALSLALALAAACAGSGAPAPESESKSESPGTPENTDWRLLELDGRPARVAENGDTPTLRLDPAEGRAGGNSGCNMYGGPYTLSGDSLRFGALVSTRRACVDPEMNRQEAAFFQALAATRTWRVTGGALVLSGENGPVARFAAQPAQ